MKVTLLGMGCGAPTLTAQARHALAGAQYIIGAPRLLKELPALCTPHRAAATRPQAILALLQKVECGRACVVFSGDSGFYSGARGLLPLLEQNGYQVQVIPGVSSVQALAAALCRPWQDWALYSAHGVECDPVAAVRGGRPAFFLTGGQLGPAALCRRLAGAGLGGLAVTVGEELGTPAQQITAGTAAELAKREFAPLSVLLAEAAPAPRRRAPGWPDDAFLRSAPGEKPIPMTKQEVRAAALAKLAAGPEDLCWDIGAGTGSVSVELALQCREVYAVEQKPEACALAEQNKAKFRACNLHLVQGQAPAALAGLPKPDAVFVGGSGGELPQILQAVHAANPAARVCVAAIALETLHTACQTLAGLGYDAEVAQISVSRAKAAGSLHLLLAQNPVFLVSAAGAAPQSGGAHAPEAAP